MEKILVHCCCGPCSTSSISRLLEEGYEPVLHYENSNIWPEAENSKRFKELEKVAQYFGGLRIIKTQYDHNSWLSFIKGLEEEPEHGKRCTKCFEYNLNRAYLKARELGIEKFTTTLTVSRFKKSETIFQVGKVFEGFVPIDFKKKDGFGKSVRMAKEMELYRQDYCGCEYSLRKGEK
ncbi:MAG: epoxyqueuosine reductase QueH [Sphaerochaetaceae bacterium]|nr:epoxyqueuosine reductase QueH [Sphaerochaetaceae bacterium]